MKNLEEFRKSEPIIPLAQGVFSVEKTPSEAFKGAIDRGFSPVDKTGNSADYVKVNEAKILSMEPLSPVLQQARSNVK